MRALTASVVAPRTVKSYLSELRTLFNFAVRCGCLNRNSAAPIDVPHCLPKLPALHSPAEVRRVLAAARESHPDFCRTPAVRCFSGLRSAAAFRLSEAEIRGDYIEVTAAQLTRDFATSSIVPGSSVRARNSLRECAMSIAASSR